MRTSWRSSSRDTEALALHCAATTDNNTTVQFGALTYATIVLAMLGDLIVLPALLAICKPR